MAICSGGDGRPVEFIDAVTLRGYCRVCASNEFTSSLYVHAAYLSGLIGYEVGERVACYTMGEFYEGDGEVVEISTELIRGGTPEHPAYLVDIDGRDEPLWFTPVCLKRIKDERSMVDG